MLAASINSLTMLLKAFKYMDNWEIFGGEMLIRTLITTLPQMFCKIILIFKVIFKSTIGPEDNFRVTLRH